VRGGLLNKDKNVQDVLKWEEEFCEEIERGASSRTRTKASIE
jgi:hypothetical protein